MYELGRLSVGAPRGSSRGFQGVQASVPHTPKFGTDPRATATFPQLEGWDRPTPKDAASCSYLRAMFSATNVATEQIQDSC